jgi:hypothetical protein
MRFDLGPKPQSQNKTTTYIIAETKQEVNTKCGETGRNRQNIKAALPPAKLLRC